MRGAQARLTFGEGDEWPQAWSPSGDRVFFAYNSPTDRERKLAAQAADGTGQPIEVLPTRAMSTADVSRDGKFLVYSDVGADLTSTGGLDLWYVRLDDDPRKPAPVVQAPTAQGDPRVSPNGRYLAYGSNETGRSEVFVKPFPTGEGKWQVSVNGGAAPRWDASGQRLFFIEPSADSRCARRVTPEPRSSRAASVLTRPPPAPSSTAMRAHGNRRLSSSALTRASCPSHRHADTLRTDM
jgi:Tol biopolymer transport system component